MGRTGILDGRRRHGTGWAQVGVRGRRGGAARRRRRRWLAGVRSHRTSAALLSTAPPWSLTTPTPEPHPPGAPRRRPRPSPPPPLPAGWPAFRSASTSTSPTAQASTANPPAMNRFRRKSESGRSRRKGADSDSNRASSLLDNDAPPPSATDPGTASPSLGLPEFGDFRQSLILVRPLPFSLERCTEPRLTPPRSSLQPGLARRFSLLRTDDGQLVDMDTMQSHVTCVLVPLSLSLARSAPPSPPRSADPRNVPPAASSARRAS